MENNEGKIFEVPNWEYTSISLQGPEREQLSELGKKGWEAFGIDNDRNNRKLQLPPTQLLPVDEMGNNFKSYLQNRGESVQETAKTLEPRATVCPWLFSFVQFFSEKLARNTKKKYNTGIQRGCSDNCTW